MGTWLYMAPEQGRGGVLGPAADVWGLGAVLCEMATERAALRAIRSTRASRTGDDRESASESEDPPYPRAGGARAPLRAHRDDLPAELTDLAAECLAPTPEDWPSVDEVLARLEPIAGTPAEKRRWS